MTKTRKSNKKSKLKKRIKKRRSVTKTTCKRFLQKKISINMKEWKEGKYKSQKQALAVSYSQTRKKYPTCKKWFL